MKLSHFTLGTVIVGLALAQGACASEGFGKPRGARRLVVELRKPEALADKDDEVVFGSALKPLPLAIDTPQAFRIVVRAVDLSGNTDPTFNGSVRISSKPGAVERFAKTDADTDGRNLKLNNGESAEVEVKVTNAYGATFILADDLGYESADPLGEAPPACANGKDDDGDGKIDFPADEGCAFANDASEGGGSYAEGASRPIFYRLPRIADARGVKCLDPNDLATCTGAGRTPYPREQLQLDTGFHLKSDGNQKFDFDMVVTRIAPDGFYVSDVSDTRGFNNVFSFNFNPPPLMRVCDRLKTFSGTATEFFGLTQISYPTWTLEEWDPQQRPCLVPEPELLGPLDVLGDFDGNGKIDVPAGMLARTASLVRVASQAVDETTTYTLKVTPKFGPGFMPCRSAKGEALDVQPCIDDPTAVFVPSPDAGTDCDLNKDGRINFGKLPTGELTAENRCSDTCTLDPERTEYSNFAGRSTFRLTVSDGNNTGTIQADATQSAEFKPLEMKGKQLRAFTGTLHFFSGGSQYTIEARCKDDIVVDLKAKPLPSDKACVFPRQDKLENPQ